MSRNFKCALVSMFAAAALAPIAFAQTPAGPASIRVAYGDLDMSTRTGGEVLLQRISAAAEKACAKAIKLSPLLPAVSAHCLNDTVAFTVRQMNITTLTIAWGGGASTTLASR